MEQVIKNATEVVKEDSLVTSSLLSGNIVGETIDNVLRNYEGIEEFIACDFGSPEEANMKKIFAKALVVAQEQGVLPPALAGLPQDVVAIASLVDESLTRIKTAAMVDVEKLYPETAVNIIIDHTAARLKVVADRVIEKGIIVATDAVIKVVSYVCPPVQLVAPAIRVFVKQCIPALQQVVRKGIDKITSAAKSIVKTIGTHVIGAVQKVGRKILSFLGL